MIKRAIPIVLLMATIFLAGTLEATTNADHWLIALFSVVLAMMWIVIFTRMEMVDARPTGSAHCVINNPKPFRKPFMSLVSAKHRLCYVREGCVDEITLVETNRSDERVLSHESSRQRHFDTTQPRELHLSLDAKGRIMKASADSLALLNRHPDDKRVDEKRRFIRVFGTPRSTMLDDIREEGNACSVARLVTGSQPRTVLWSFEAKFDDALQVTSILVTGHDISESIELNAWPVRADHVDFLTGLLNQQGIYSRLENETTDRAVAVFITIDDFKRVREYHGHAYGDDVLKNIATHLSTIGDVGVVMGRFSDDTFVVIYTGPKADDEADELVKKTQDTLPGRIDDKAPSVGLRTFIGYAVYPDDTETLEELLSSADMAMQHGRTNNQRVCRYRHDMKELIALRMAQEQALREVLNQDSVEVVFQEIVDASTKAVVFVEQLARFHKSTLSSMAVDAVFALAQSINVLPQLERQVMKKALQGFITLKKKARYSEAILGLNMAPETFMNSESLAYLNHHVDALEIKRHWVSVEVSERTFVGALMRCKERIDDYKSEGYQIALDDFGREYSSLAVLDSVAFDIIKVDRVFTANLTDNMRSREIVTMVHRITSLAGKRMVVEGVETDAQRTLLLAMGCTLQQGYLWHRPTPID